jgi:hypothetical protein
VRAGLGMRVFTIKLSLLVCLATVVACEGHPSARPLVVSRKGASVVAIVELASDQSSRLLGDDVRDAIPCDDGQRILLQRGSEQPFDLRTRLSFLRVGRKDDRLEPVAAALDAFESMLDVSADGMQLLTLAKGDLKDIPWSVRMVDLATGKHSRHRFRYVASGTVSPDGKEALVSAVPLECSHDDVDACPLQMFRLDAVTGALKLVRPGPGANYQARYLPDGRVAFQTTELAAGCTGTSRCRHDVVTVPRSDLGAAPAVLRKGAYSPAFSPAGDKLAFLVHDEKGNGCSSLPCSTASLYVMAIPDGQPVRIAVGEVANLDRRGFSPDGKWLAYNTRADTKVCRVDGKHCSTIASDAFRGWVR